MTAAQRVEWKRLVSAWCREKGMSRDAASAMMMMIMMVIKHVRIDRIKQCRCVESCRCDTEIPSQVQHLDKTSFIDMHLDMDTVSEVCTGRV